MTKAPNAAVSVPPIARVAEASGAAAKIGDSRTKRKPPALIIPACMKADTGVGVSIVSGSQLWKGNCADFNMAHAARHIPASPRPAASPAATAAKIASRSNVR